MRITSLFVGAVLLASSLAQIVGCNDNKEDPFKEWYAAEKYENYVPNTALVVAEGSGALSYAPTTKGTLYLVDLDDMRKVKEATTPHVLFAGKPLPGSAITFEPQTSTLSREGKKPLKLTGITPGHRHQFRWQADAAS